MGKEKKSSLSVYLLKKVSARKTSRWSGYFLIFISFIALFAPVVCNEKPWYVNYHNVSLFPAFSLKGYADIKNENDKVAERLVYSTVDWNELASENIIHCPVRYSPGKSDWLNSDYKSPFDSQNTTENGKTIPLTFKKRHWLGTTKTGADVLSGLMHGARYSLTIGIFSMIIAGLLGILFGSFAGFFGDHKIIISKAGLIFAILLGLPLSYFYGIYLPFFSSSNSHDSVLAILFLIIASLLIISICIFLSYTTGKFISRKLRFNSTTRFPADQVISRGIEIFNSIPRIVLIITLSAISRPSAISLILIIGFTSWTEIARLVRAEMLKVRASEFMMSAEASGINLFRQIIHHALPNVVIPGLTAITLGVASAILTESALSFLGIGVPADVVTWGSLLNEGRQNFSAWWLVLFPGLAIFLTVASINILGDALNEAIDSKNR